MMNNDVLRSVRYMLKLSNNDMVAILALADSPVPVEQMVAYTKKEEEEGFQRCPDVVINAFLNGLIYSRRGKDESRPALRAERKTNNNIILKKLRVAFALKTDDIVAIMLEQKLRISLPEVTAMMRAPDHKNYRECGDQFLRNFLRGLAARLRPA